MLLLMLSYFQPPRPPRAPLVRPRFTPLTAEDYQTEFIKFGGLYTKKYKTEKGYTKKRKHEHIIKTIR